MEYYFVRFRDFRVHTKKSPLSLTQGHQDDLRHRAGEEGRVCWGGDIGLRRLDFLTVGHLDARICLW